MAAECDTCARLSERVHDMEKAHIECHATIAPAIERIEANLSKMAGESEKTRKLLTGNGDVGLAEIVRKHDASINRSRAALWFLFTAVFGSGIAVGFRWLVLT